MDHSALARTVLNAKPILLSKLATACHVDDNGASAVLCEAIRFLDLCAHASGALTPSPIVDDAWHEFVLCTRLYAEFCQLHFGRFIHHDPGGTDETNARQFRKTLYRYAQRFGDPDPKYWGAAAARTPSANCGGCESA